MRVPSFAGRYLPYLFMPNTIHPVNQPLTALGVIGTYPAYLPVSSMPVLCVTVGKI